MGMETGWLRPEDGASGDEQGIALSGRASSDLRFFMGVAESWPGGEDALEVELEEGLEG